MMKISIVIPTLNEATYITRTLHTVASQSLSDNLKVELLIVDGGSTDGTPERIIEFF
jgi:glycosyltransferase involved in cell wall biosynthesis